jgi:hypothetical protein
MCFTFSRVPRRNFASPRGWVVVGQGGIGNLKALMVDGTMARPTETLPGSLSVRHPVSWAAAGRIGNCVPKGIDDSVHQWTPGAPWLFFPRNRTRYSPVCGLRCQPRVSCLRSTTP